MTLTDRPRTRGRHQPGASGRLAEAFVLLDNSSGTSAHSLMFSDPVDVVVAREPGEVGDALKRLEEGIARGLHAAGFFSYELGYVLEPHLSALLPTPRNVPLMWFGLYDAPDVMTGGEVEGWLATNTLSATYQFTDVTRAWTRAEYERRFAEVQEKIRAGDIYQLNLTFKARFKLSGSPLAFYRDMRQRQRVAYAGIVDTGEVTVLSASPELFIAQQGRVIETRPMKGTSSRAGTPDADASKKRVLATDVKQRAENLMIVDLMRNDLGRIAEIGSVEVTDLFTVETFRTLHQMTSGVRAKLVPGIGLRGLIEAIFPPGSVIGAPKIRAMELISDYETEPRGVYCGAIGHISPKGDALFNVAIRTPVVFRDGTGEMGIGSGVIYDSEGSKEYDECLLKMKFLTDPPKAFELIETMLYEPGLHLAEDGIWLRDRHMKRLAESAEYFRFAFDRRAVEAMVANATATRRDERLRLRLLLDEKGAATVTLSPQPPQAADAVMRYVLSPSRLTSADPFLFHKTTRRELYDREWQQYNASLGADEVIYVNERDELCEGSRTTIFVERDGVLLTPPLESGLLPGTLRAEMLASGRAVEAPLTLADLMPDACGAAAGVWLGNSVRGLMRAEALLDTAESN